MAAIVITSSGGGTIINGTDNFIPYKFSSNQFSDSLLFQNTINDLRTVDANTGNVQGIIINNDVGFYSFGDIDGMFIGSYIQITPDGSVSLNGSKIFLNTNSLIEMSGAITATTAGGASGEHLELTINGTKYKIALLNA